MPYTTQENLTDIRRRLGLLVVDVQISNKHNLQDVNVSSEPFMARLINVIRGTNYIDLNTVEKMNTAGIDIGDLSIKKSIQITASVSHKKVQDSILKFEKTRIDQGYANLDILFLVGGKISLTKDFETNDRHTFSIKDNIFTVDDLYSEITRLSPEDIAKVCELIKDEIRLDEANKFTREISLLRNYFRSVETISEEKLESIDDEFESADLSIKKIKFDAFWEHLEQTYLSIMDQRLEKTFKAVYDGLDQPERENLKKYLRYESTRLLLEEQDPVRTIELLKQKMIIEMKMNLISEISVLNFIYYQFYRCNVFPLRRNDGN